MNRVTRIAAIIVMTLALAYLLTHDAQTSPVGMLAALTIWAACGAWLLVPRLTRLVDPMGGDDE